MTRLPFPVRRAGRRASRRRAMAGGALVELALVAIPTISIGLAALDVGRAIHVYNQMLKSTRDAARYLAAFDPSNPGLYPTQQAIYRAVYGTTSKDAGAQPVAAGLTESMVQICDRVSIDGCAGNSYTMTETSPQNGQVHMVRVQITGYAFKPMMPGASRLLPFSFGNVGATMRQVR